MRAIMRAITAALMIAATLLGVMASEPASAHGRVHVGVGFGFGGYWPGYWGGWPGYWGAPYPYYAPYYYQPAVTSAPVTYIERADEVRAPASTGRRDWWYLCPETKTYYPYVKECPGGWQKVEPQPSAER